MRGSKGRRPLYYYTNHRPISIYILQGITFWTVLLSTLSNVSLKGYFMIQMSSYQCLFIVSFCRYSWKKHKSEISRKSDIPFQSLAYGPKRVFHWSIWYCVIILFCWQNEIKHQTNLPISKKRGNKLHKSFGTWSWITKYPFNYLFFLLWNHQVEQHICVTIKQNESDIEQHQFL